MPYSVTIFTSIDANPKIAFVGTPVDVAIDSGSAKKARYTRLLPSIRNRVSAPSRSVVALAVVGVVSVATSSQ